MVNNMNESEFEKALASSCNAIIENQRKDMLIMSKDNLEKYWFFSWNDDESISYNIYKFNYFLEIYSGRCREWEETHNGYECVVERVRDEYILPKCRDFEILLRDKMEIQRKYSLVEILDAINQYKSE